MSGTVCLSGSGEMSNNVLPSGQISVPMEVLKLARWEVPTLSPPNRPSEEWRSSPYRDVGSGNPMIRLSFYHLDHLGTPRVITDASGQPISRHKYLPYGEELDPPPSLNTHEFTGHERDGETGLDYMLARYYSSKVTLRFASVDPAPPHMIVPQTFTRYTYAGNNPIVFSDPTGRAIYNKAVDPATRVSANLLTTSLTIQMQSGGQGPDLIIRNVNRPIPHPAGGLTDGRFTAARDSNGNLIAVTIDIYPRNIHDRRTYDSNRTYSATKHELGHAANEADGLLPTHPPSNNPNAPDERRATERGNVIAGSTVGASAGSLESVLQPVS